MKIKVVRSAVPALGDVPLMARLRDGGVNPWHRVGTVRRVGKLYIPSFDRASALVAPAWPRLAEKPRSGRDDGPFVQFGALVGGAVVVVANGPVTSRVLFESACVAPRERRHRIRDARCGGPAALRSSFPDPSRLSASRGRA